MAQAWWLDGAAKGALVTECGITTDTGVLAIWVLYAAGRCEGGPKRRRREMQSIARVLESIGRAYGAREIRAEERSAWGAVLLDMGFERATKPSGGVLFRKAI